MKLLMTALAAGVLMAAAGIARGAPSAKDAGGAFLDDYDRARRSARLDTLTTEIQSGLADLTRHFIRGGATPLPPAPGIEFLLLRAFHTGRQDLRDTGLGAAAAWLSLHLDMYGKHGLPVDPNAPGGPTRKEAAREAELLSIAVSAFQASGKEMFRTAALRLAGDLRGWSLRNGTIHGWMQVDPDTAFGPPATPDERARMAAAFAAAGAVFAAPEWREAAGIAAGPDRGEAPEDTAAQTVRGLAWRLAARLDAAVALGDAPGLAAAAGALIDRARAGSDPADAEGPAWAAYALARYAARAHDDTARAAAETWADRCRAAADPERRNMELFRALAAEAYALEFLARPAPLAYIVAEPGDPRGAALLDAALAASRPGRLIARHAPDAEALLYPASAEGPVAYVCSGHLCAPPTGEPADVRSLLETFALPETAPAPGFGLDGLRP